MPVVVRIALVEMLKSPGHQLDKGTSFSLFPAVADVYVDQK